MTIPKSSVCHIWKPKPSSGLVVFDGRKPWHLEIYEIHVLGFHRNTYPHTHSLYYRGPGGDNMYNRGVAFEWWASKAGYVSEICMN